jgi:hypothetical protein
MFGGGHYLRFDNTVKPVYKDHSRDPKFLAVVDRQVVVVQMYLFVIKKTQIGALK